MWGRGLLGRMGVWLLVARSLRGDERLHVAFLALRGAAKKGEGSAGLSGARSEQSRVAGYSVGGNRPSRKTSDMMIQSVWDDDIA